MSHFLWSDPIVFCRGKGTVRESEKGLKSLQQKNKIFSSDLVSERNER